MGSLKRQLAWACVSLLLVAGVVWAATDINLKQSDGTHTEWGGVGDAAKVSVVGGAGAGGSGCMATAAAPTYSEGVANYLSCTLGGLLRISFGDLFFFEDPDNQLARVSGAWVRQDTIMTGVTTNTTSAPVVGFTGSKSLRAEVAGTGAVTATITLFCDDDNDAANGDQLGQITLSGTTLAKDRLPPITAPCKYLYATTTNVTGTGAAVLARVSY